MSLWGLLALLCISFAAPDVTAQDAPARVATLDATAALRASEAAIGRVVADHPLVDRRERPVSLASYRGKPLLVSFVYTGCFDVCPVTTQALALAVDRLNSTFGSESFNVVSVGFNQPFDSPAAMRAFAAKAGAAAANWEFVSPAPDSVDALLGDFGFTYVATPTRIDHVLAVSVLDGDGRIYAHVYGDRPSPEQLAEPLRQMLSGMPRARAASLADIVERVRVLCTVYDPVTGQYRYDYGLILEIAGGVTFAVAMAWFFLLEWRTRRRLRRAPESGPEPLTVAHR